MAGRTLRLSLRLFFTLAKNVAAYSLKENSKRQTQVASVGLAHACTPVAPRALNFGRAYVTPLFKVTRSAKQPLDHSLIKTFLLIYGAVKTTKHDQGVAWVYGKGH